MLNSRSRSFAFFLLIAGMAACAKSPVDPNANPTPCDTCGLDTSVYHPPSPNDSTSHNFAWKTYSLPNESNVTGCWVFGPNSIYVVASSLLKFDGNSWQDRSPMTALNGTLLGGRLQGFTMFALSESNYWLTSGHTCYHFDSAPAEENYSDSLSGGSSLSNTWGSPDGSLYAVGDAGTILHYSGSVWSKMSNPTSTLLRSVWGTTSRDVWASGTDPGSGKSVLLHYNGIGWSEDPASVVAGPQQGSGFSSIWTVDSLGHKCTMVMGRELLRKTDNQGWSMDTAGVPNDGLRDQLRNYGGVTGISPNDFVVFGPWGFLSHWNGRSWYSYSFFYESNNFSTGIKSVSMRGNTICAVGSRDGKSWIAIGQR